MEKSLKELMSNYNYCVIKYERDDTITGYIGLFGFILGNKFLYVTLKDVYNTVLVFDKKNIGNLEEIIDLASDKFKVNEITYHKKSEYVFLDKEIDTFSFIDYLNPVVLRGFLEQNAQKTIGEIKKERLLKEQKKKEEREKKAIEKIVKKSPSSNSRNKKNSTASISLSKKKEKKDTK